MAEDIIDLVKDMNFTNLTESWVLGSDNWWNNTQSVIGVDSEALGYLTEEANEAVKKLLPDYAKGDLAAVCSWADEIRFHYRWSSALHFVDTPDFRCKYDYFRDCHDSAGRVERCVAGAINNYSKQLSAYNQRNLEQTYNYTEALLFLSHFIGDVHQPLHCGFIGDEGGNTIIVRWYRRKTNLHHVWDTMIIESAIKEFYSSDLQVMVRGLQKSIWEDWNRNISSWGTCESNQTVCPNLYASESVDIACKYAYRNASPGTTLGDQYFNSRLPIVKRRLAQAGVRLAATLNRIFSPDHHSQPSSVRRSDQWGWQWVFVMVLKYVLWKQ